MFSGLIAHLGIVTAFERDSRGGVSLEVEAPDAIAEGVAPKDSIAIDGVCLTVVAHGAGRFRFDVVPETLQRSTLGTLRPGAVVNVELSLRLGDRLGGHLVYGHVDATTTMLNKIPEGQGYRLVLATPAALAAYVVEKGYVALDGVSLTVAATGSDFFEIALIPESANRTTLGRKISGARLNIEIDPIARYALAAAGRYTLINEGTSDELAWAYEI